MYNKYADILARFWRAQLRVNVQTWISGSPSAFPIVVAVKSLPPLPNVVTAHDFRAWKK